ncbi:MAG: type II toxin-antitoxin system RelE/ParE family toxin [Patescibacteria group bacterium]
MYKVVFTTKASREYKKLSKQAILFIDRALDELNHDPFSQFLDIKKLKNPLVGFRLRVREWRIIYGLEKEQIIRIYSIKDRKDAYRL